MELNTWQASMKRHFSNMLIEFNSLMSGHTYFKIGGRADALFFPRNEQELKEIYLWCMSNEIPFMVIGNCTNLLVSDKGIRGVVAKIDEKMSNITVKDNQIWAEAGALLSQVAQTALKHSLSGMEFAAGIPGSIGGAVYMNAGAYDGEMKDIVQAVKVLTAEGNIKLLQASELQLDYRYSSIAEEKAIVTAVLLCLQKGKPEDIRVEMNKLNTWRRERQPLAKPSAGSTFKRPPGIAGSYLIDQAGLKGYSIGGAQVSEKHAGFIINKGGATAQDVLDLMAHVQKEVYKKFNILLDPEVKIIGEPMTSDLIIKH